MEVNFAKLSVYIGTDSDVSSMIVKMIGLHKILSRCNPPTSYLLNYAEHVDWKYVSNVCNPETAEVCASYVNWNQVIKRYDDTWLPNITNLRRWISTKKIKRYIFNNKNRFYTREFVSTAYFLVNWHWVLQNMVLNEHVIINVFPYFQSDMIAVKLCCLKQPINSAFLHKYQRFVIWTEIVKRPLNQKIIEQFIQFLNIDMLFMYQKLPIEFINSYKFSVYNGNVTIPTYQILPEMHILINRKFYDMMTVLKHQNISLEFIATLAEFGLKKEWMEIIREKFSVVDVPQWNLIIVGNPDTKILYVDSCTFKVRSVSSYSTQNDL